MSNDVVSNPVAVLRLPRTNLALIAFALAIHDALAANATAFVTPDPPLTEFAADIDAFNKAEVVTATKVKGASTTRNAKKRKVVQQLRHYRDYVQAVSEKAASPGEAAALIVLAGMALMSIIKRYKALFRATNLGVAGSVQLDAKAVAHSATYYWSFSLDQKSWVSVPDTMKARTVISGLTSGQTYYFRFRAMTRTGTSDFSQVVSLLVT